MHQHSPPFCPHRVGVEYRHIADVCWNARWHVQFDMSPTRQEIHCWHVVVSFVNMPVLTKKNSLYIIKKLILFQSACQPVRTCRVITFLKNCMLFTRCPCRCFLGEVNTANVYNYLETKPQRFNLDTFWLSTWILFCLFIVITTVRPKLLSLTTTIKFGLVLLIICSVRLHRPCGVQKTWHNLFS